MVRNSSLELLSLATDLPGAEGRAADDEHHAVPVNLKDHDAFHLTIEEYLLALVSLVDELVRCSHIHIPQSSTNP